MKSSTSINLVLLVVFFLTTTANCFSQISLPTEIKKNLTTQQLEQIKIANKLVADANTKLGTAEKIENENTKLKQKNNSKKYEKNIWEAKACRIAAQELTLESDIIISNMYLEVFQNTEFINKNSKKDAIQSITQSQLKLEVANESFLWFKNKVQKKLADVLNSTVISFMETIQNVQKESNKFQNQAITLYLTNNKNIQLLGLE